MQRINKDVVKEYLEKGGKASLAFAREIYGSTLEEAGNKAFAAAIELGIENTVAALYESKADDQEIINLLNKYWGISRNEAINRLLHEKNQAPIRELRSFLTMQGYSSKEIQHFMISNNVAIKLRKNPELRELRHKPEKLMKAVKEK